MKKNEYKCAVCDKTYSKGWSEEEALAELKDKFDTPVEECAIVCDGCYKKMGLKDEECE